MKLTKRPFGTLEGAAVTCWTLENDNGCRAEVLDYGVTIRSIVVPDRTGKPVDVVLGYDTLEEYTSQDACLGATIGRFANRIGRGVFTLNGRTYHLAINNGPNHLHGGPTGYYTKIWKTEETGRGLRFTHVSPDGDEGYPGCLTVSVEVFWEGDGLRLQYHAESDQDTVLNLTNHTYFNLDGHDAGTIYDHLLTLHADSFTLNDGDCLPTGEIVPVAGTAMDFRTEKPMGRDVDADEPCVKLCRGYDSNYILTEQTCAVARSEKTGIHLTVTTDQPGVQFYTANFLSDRRGKNGARYAERCGFCLETQHYPDCIHHPDWPTCILRKGEAFDSFTVFGFHA